MYAYMYAYMYVYMYAYMYMYVHTYIHAQQQLKSLFLATEKSNSKTFPLIWTRATQ